ncbi:MAG: leucine--tRNA ligase [Candidatus Hydrothermarchaeota archaeon]
MSEWREFEAKWQEIWKKEGLHHSKPQEKPKFYITVAYPYPSGSMHVGHGRTYTVPDVIARFKRMQGYNVLFPMAWHVTGAPVVGIASRFQRGDQSVLSLYKDLYRVDEKTLSMFTNPHKIVEYFCREYKNNMNRIGYSIDWRREFTTTDPQYNKFIEWQFRKLREKGYVARGEHPVKWCPNDKNPVGDHDLLEGEEANILAFTLLKFEYNDYKIPCGTLRPETVFGATNLWVRPDIDYIVADVDGEKWIISEESVEKLKEQGYNVHKEKIISGKVLVGKYAKNPALGNQLIILPASFVDPDYASGIVMSVPAHAPYDYVALKQLKDDSSFLEEYNIDVSQIEPISLIEVEGYGEYPAKEIVEKYNVNDQNDKKLEELTEEIYRIEFAKGRMLGNIPKYGNYSVFEAREMVKNDFIKENKANLMWDFSEKPVICRCGTKCLVKLLSDQWFLKYSDKEWKESARKCLNQMIIVPEEVRANFLYVIDWLNDWACARKIGLGTRIPWDLNWIVEPLSDSTVYMAYYTISHIIKNLSPDQLDDNVFDYIFFGLGSPEEISEKKNISIHALKAMRREFTYWYPVNIRFSAKDLIGNHLSFHIFHHTAIFPEENWPRGIVVFGIGLLEGEKMSSSKGNVILFQDALERYGGDTTRMYLMFSADPWQDFDWQERQIRSMEQNLQRFWKLANDIIDMDSYEDEVRSIDRWLLSRLQERIRETTNSLNSFQTRRAVQESFFSLMRDVRRYLRRAKKPNKEVLMRVMNVWIRLLAPFIPHMCEELWERMGNSGFVFNAEWPKVDEKLIDYNVELAEEYIDNLMADIEAILKITNITPKNTYIYLAPPWKDKVYRVMLKERLKGKIEFPKILDAFKKDEELKSYTEEIKKFALLIIDEVNKMHPERIKKILDFSLEEKDILWESKDFLSDQTKTNIHIVTEEEAYDPKNKRKHAKPFKPAIYME